MRTELEHLIIDRFDCSSVFSPSLLSLADLSFVTADLRVPSVGKNEVRKIVLASVDSG